MKGETEARNWEKIYFFIRTTKIFFTTHHIKNEQKFRQQKKNNFDKHKFRQHLKITIAYTICAKKYIPNDTTLHFHPSHFRSFVLI